MPMLKNTTATKLLGLVCLLAACLFGQAHAQSAGQVINLSGPLFAVKADGGKRVMSVGSAVDAGDTLITEAKTYARIRFTDASEVTLRPESRLMVEGFSFKQEEPAKDSAVFKLLKGALRTVTGLVGKRGNQDAYKLNTPTATIGIRGTQFIVEYVPEIAPNELSMLPVQLAQASAPSRPSSAMPPGLYVQVIDGLIHLSNTGGSQSFSAGQFGFAPNPNTPPVILPSNPGLQFTPPPAFGAPQTSGTQGGSPAGGSGCEVR